MKVLRTRADLSFALVHNLKLLTHFAKRAENERCFSRQNLHANRDEEKTEMAKKYTGTSKVANSPCAPAPLWFNSVPEACAIFGF
jgi:hypothetical protein